MNKPSIIILDNLKYHESKPSNTAKPSRLKRNEVVAELRKYNIVFDINETVLELKKKLRDYIRNNVEAAITHVAREKGHEVLFTPPHFSDLQPIELVWAHVKGSIARAYTNSTSFQDVRDRLDRQFEMLCTSEGESIITNIIHHVDKILTKLVTESRNRENILQGGSETETESDCDNSFVFTDDSEVDD